jgi:hypothetical protein
MTQKTQKKLLLFFHFEKKKIVFWKGGKKPNTTLDPFKIGTHVINSLEATPN